MSENKFVQSYNDLMRHLYEIMDDGLHSLADGLEKAKAKTHALGILTPEEMQKIGGFLQRDIEGAAHALHTEKQENLSEWLKFDVNLIESFALDAFMEVADKTSIELAQLKRHGEQNVYYSGEITAPGTLTCTACAKEMAFKSAAEIPDCPACGAKAFVRSVTLIDKSSV
ncbi:MAG: zinc ribbon-containing protein [Methylococcaceae bacterium]|nr:zinc ribbon-containing protein [Methylococcaceae bacterium]